MILSHFYKKEKRERKKGLEDKYLRPFDFCRVTAPVQLQ